MTRINVGRVSRNLRVRKQLCSRCDTYVFLYEFDWTLEPRKFVHANLLTFIRKLFEKSPLASPIYSFNLDITKYRVYKLFQSERTYINNKSRPSIEQVLVHFLKF